MNAESKSEESGLRAPDLNPDSTITSQFCGLGLLLNVPPWGFS